MNFFILVTRITTPVRTIGYIGYVETQKGIGATMDLGEVLRACRCLSPLVGHADIQRNEEPAEILFRGRDVAGSQVVQ